MVTMALYTITMADIHLYCPNTSQIYVLSDEQAPKPCSSWTLLFLLLIRYLQGSKLCSWCCLISNEAKMLTYCHHPLKSLLILIKKEICINRHAALHDFMPEAPATSTSFSNYK